MIKEKVGIDYGSKLAGTTVIAYEIGEAVHLMKSKKGEDADKMIWDFVTEHQVKVVGLDAPLSLPGVYSNDSEYDDYFYRSCDKELKAMSPMFLGGLTARAMKLKNALESAYLKMYEVYPAKVALELGLKAYGYKTKTADYNQILSILNDCNLKLSKETTIETPHDLDGILALYVAKRIGTSSDNSVGKPKEGLIYY
ncbi:hypothetical protein [Roseivirga sp.]|uniref:hypothetical protein n=1 Tax=Roseivirga sp. TaxID=1964215 RepID=UPI003B8AD1A7